MEIYKNGKVVSVGKTYIIFESNYTGSIVYVPNIENFVQDEKLKLFIYKYSTEYTTAIYGFKTFKERLLFEDLISISGVGPKTAMSLLKEGKDTLIQMIINEDIDNLSSLPYLGIKTARQIIFELSEKYTNFESKSNSKGLLLPGVAKDSLKTLGFNTRQIEYAIKNTKPQRSMELLVEEAIRVISSAKFP